ncbi:hypothetical protein CH63R_02062 [Colletotrichum higginsianum IMI 349063]|uniref:Uncharacterized protein n=1 Tax=Colletotrichum higginsianum (strain IMI 349063) TaxID=759273 RepID=A0A1B7YMQ0_COLHI|nr:hypothetical protein CH63R_02062 [Colletotrichum higginsianum IMI 349063]OBR13336.1 hypothetical protein CH63R_02062 [Colletotrichum higginsianum IMI 349063]
MCQSSQDRPDRLHQPENHVVGTPYDDAAAVPHRDDDAGGPFSEEFQDPERSAWASQGPNVPDETPRGMCPGCPAGDICIVTLDNDDILVRLKEEGRHEHQGDEMGRLFEAMVYAIARWASGQAAVSPVLCCH